MNTIFEVQPFVDWLIEILSVSTGKQFGDTLSPVARPEKGDFPYGIVDSIPGGNITGTMSAPDADADLIFQVTSCGLSAKQARWLSDRVRVTLLARNPNGTYQVAPQSPKGWDIAERRPYGGSPVPVPEDTYTPTVYNVPERFVLRVTPGE